MAANAHNDARCSFLPLYDTFTTLSDDALYDTKRRLLHCLSGPLTGGWKHSSDCDVAPPPAAILGRFLP
ncbi:hypothetical protein NDU88_001847 [Pleurodeles waltl]|uniref:Uncharacterized protein n=1 Tax=Pleurodeles waltl TaxID=8319 RepID=A0AAV7P802_PLEWA|nr:hypothetical protein NDU88_001847 [Pleurodeles waltl]